MQIKITIDLPEEIQTYINRIISDQTVVTTKKVVNESTDNVTPITSKKKSIFDDPKTTKPEPEIDKTRVQRIKESLINLNKKYDFDHKHFLSEYGYKSPAHIDPKHYEEIENEIEVLYESYASEEKEDDNDGWEDDSDDWETTDEQEEPEEVDDDAEILRGKIKDKYTTLRKKDAEFCSALLADYELKRISGLNRLSEPQLRHMWRAMSKHKA